MKTIRIEQDSQVDGAMVKDVVRVLERGGLVCLPCGGSYRIVADLNDPAAVMRLVQSKRRTRKAPALVFIDCEKRLEGVAAEVDPVVRRLTRALWPGPLTILVDAHPDLPAKVIKQLAGGEGRLGVRIPGDPLARAIAAEFGGPLLVSSANREARAGAESPAQVRKTFMGRVDLMLDAGDLRPAVPSSVVDVKDGRLIITRAGALDESRIRAVLDAVAA